MSITPAKPSFGFCVTAVDHVTMRLVLDANFCGRPEVFWANGGNRVITRRVREVSSLPRCDGLEASPDHIPLAVTNAAHCTSGLKPRERGS